MSGTVNKCSSSSIGVSDCSFGLCRADAVGEQFGERALDELEIGERESGARQRQSRLSCIADAPSRRWRR